MEQLPIQPVSTDTARLYDIFFKTLVHVRECGEGGASGECGVFEEIPNHPVGSSSSHYTAWRSFPSIMAAFYEWTPQFCSIRQIFPPVSRLMSSDGLLKHT